MHLLFIGEREEDLQLCERICAATGIELNHDAKAARVTTFLKDNKDSVVFWDIDHPTAGKAASPISVAQVSQRIVRSKIKFDRIFTLGDEPMNSIPHAKNLPVVGAHVERRYTDALDAILSKIVAATLKDDPFGLENYVDDVKNAKKIQMTEARHRGLAIEAINNTFIQRGLKPQIVSIITQCTDEMLMNAIYDAPIDEHQYNYHKQRDRVENFLLTEKERVLLEVADTENYIAISVSDNFGSLEKDVVLNFLRKDYENEDYKVKKDVVGAGLGVYGMLQSGASLLFIAKPGEMTEVVLFIPKVKSMRKFREQFHFFAFIMRAADVE
jgi:hypothetical protein